nr:MAG TPA: hypothetical protein [Caudoviricetes sp.]
MQGIRTKKTQRKYKEKTNDDNSPLRPISYLCSRDLRGAVFSIEY